MLKEKKELGEDPTLVGLWLRNWHNLENVRATYVFVSHSAVLYLPYRNECLAFQNGKGNVILFKSNNSNITLLHHDQGADIVWVLVWSIGEPHCLSMATPSPLHTVSFKIPATKWRSRQTIDTRESTDDRGRTQPINDMWAMFSFTPEPTTRWTCPKLHCPYVYEADSTLHLQRVQIADKGCKSVASAYT